MNTRSVFTADEKKSIDTWYPNTLRLCSFDIRTYTHEYANMLTIYLRNYSSKTGNYMRLKESMQGSFVDKNKQIFIASCLLSLYSVILWQISYKSSYTQSFSGTNIHFFLYAYTWLSKKKENVNVSNERNSKPLLYLLFRKKIIRIIRTERSLFPNSLPLTGQETWVSIFFFFQKFP